MMTTCTREFFSDVPKTLSSVAFKGQDSRLATLRVIGGLGGPLIGRVRTLEFPKAGVMRHIWPSLQCELHEGRGLCVYGDESQELRTVPGMW